MKDKLNSPSFILGGHSRLPKDLAPGVLLEITMEVNLSTGDITEVSVDPCLPVTHEFIRRIMVGKNIHKDVESIINTIHLRLLHRTKKAIMAAIRDAIRQLQEYQSPRVSVQEKESGYGNT